MKKLKLNWINYNKNDILFLDDYSDFKYLKKHGYIEIISEYIHFGNNIDKFRNKIENELYSKKNYNGSLLSIKTRIRYIKYILENYQNISISIEKKYNKYLKFLIIQKKKYHKNFNLYYKDKEYFNIYKKARINKKNLNYNDLFNNLLKNSRYNKYENLYKVKTKIRNNIIDQLKDKYNLLNRGNNQVIIHDKNDYKKNNHITFYLNGIGLFKDNQLLKTFTYKNNINILKYIKF